LTTSGKVSSFWSLVEVLWVGSKLGLVDARVNVKGGSASDDDDELSVQISTGEVFS